jgi:acyl-CoA thioester hydrolase
LNTLPLYRAQIQPEWIDYNGHLRDAFYVVVLSDAIDDFMDHLGLDAAYRERTRCTLYTLELHMHYLHEVKGSEPLDVETSILDADAKRIHSGCRFTCGRSRNAGATGGAVPTGNAAPWGDTVATGEVMLLHVHQGDKPASAPFPRDIERKLQSLKLSGDASAAWGPGSRKIELKRRAIP